MAIPTELESGNKSYSTLQLILVLIEGFTLTLVGGFLSFLSLSLPDLYMFIVLILLAFFMFFIGFHIIFVTLIAIIKK
ncbi:MAG: hypothetical protein QXG46_05655 [Ignisphaera sp.]|uniref:Uncharacterized protein n=1 Tax=Ignisphaera aggregans TaxID=334771 RepID=A0A7C4H747_9CREN